MSGKKEKVVVAMSGGVDSSVAAALLCRKGFEVIGLTMCFNLADSAGKKPSCCGIQGIEDARRVAHQLGIRHYVVSMRGKLDELIIQDFCQEYLLGRTPNPCVRCNQYLKFDILLKKALSLNARYLATGHYARIEKGARYALRKAKDKRKDQSYFLYRLNQQQLRHILFPLGDYTKEEVRKKARAFGLAVADKAGSQEICFLSGGDYRDFLKSRLGNKIKPGPTIDSTGNYLGLHKGVAFYTIGQREGLGIARGYPVYITAIDSKNNTLTIGKKEEVFKSRFIVTKPHFILKGIPKIKIEAAVKIRYNHKESAAKIEPAGRALKVSFQHPQFAITPGQSAVFFKQDKVLGGGIIDRVES